MNVQHNLLKKHLTNSNNTAIEAHPQEYRRESHGKWHWAWSDNWYATECWTTEGWTGGRWIPSCIWRPNFRGKWCTYNKWDKKQLNANSYILLVYTRRKTLQLTSFSYTLAKNIRCCHILGLANHYMTSQQQFQRGLLFLLLQYGIPADKCIMSSIINLGKYYVIMLQMKVLLCAYICNPMGIWEWKGVHW